MKAYQREFIEFALSKQVLKFGEFTLKSGRKSPYFFNAGLFNSGRDLARLGRYYAAALVDAGIDYDVLFGPAYKGIPIASATACPTLIFFPMLSTRWKWVSGNKIAKGMPGKPPPVPISIIVDPSLNFSIFKIPNE